MATNPEKLGQRLAPLADPADRAGSLGWAERMVSQGSGAVQGKDHPRSCTITEPLRCASIEPTTTVTLGQSAANHVAAAVPELPMLRDKQTPLSSCF